MIDTEGMPGMDMDAATSSSHAEAAASATANPSLAASPVVAADTAVDHDASATAVAGMDGMGSMGTLFHVGTGDALWVPSLTPTTGAGYAGAIILLMLLAALLRFVVALEHLYDKRRKGKRAVVEAEEAGSSFKHIPSKQDDPGRVVHRFKVSVLLPRALFLVVTMTLGYLLMLAVMTFNLGYLLAILGGGVLGEIAFGWVKD